MKLSQLLLLCFSIVSYSCKSQNRLSRIEIVQPTLQQEATSIWRTINDYTFFENQGYNINLPKDSLIDSLIAKSKNGTFGDDDFPSIYALLERTYFNQENYTKAIHSVENQVELIDELIEEIHSDKGKWDWNFKMFDKYQVVFTLYGTGGSYDPDNGTITLLTTKDGGFMNYDNPAYTVIHEITHMGMEYALVRKYNLAHGLKERIVDTFVWLMFQERLPEYQIQNMGDKRIDNHLNDKLDIESLDATLSKFVQN